ncbi:uncharacterized protein I206_103090 [Kwoniella pini CBS 10737]|uniref:Integral membrane protein n=1 Tax=Kwoniella pini CBS 10737 TaxID=1296096 RepID=A0A1B9IAV3_9TREE|nr:uncharacterized protein I206_01906 [Kwoniella pini CBS 10737]OCF52613.1 integral membrane protein [Kwoniella pini CBS 10737]
MRSTNEQQPLLSPSATTTVRDEWQHLNPGRKRLIVATTMLTSFLANLDLTIVATCVPTISSELYTSDQEAWIGTAYLWSSVTFTPLYGRLSDIIGRRTAYLQALTLFTLGTFCCGIAPNFTLLVIARFVAGMGGGGMSTVASVLLADIFTPAERGFYQGLAFAFLGAGIGLGGPVGGYLTQWFGWRAAFYAQIPIAIVAIIQIILVVPHHVERLVSWNKLKEVDFGGALTLLISVGALLQLLSRNAETQSITQSPIDISMAITFPLFLILFVYIELKVAAKPVLPISLLKKRTPLCVGIISGLIAAVNFNMIYHLPEFFEIVFEESVAKAGAHLLPSCVALTISAPLMGYLCKKTLKYKWLTVVNCAGPVIAMSFFITMNDQSSWAVKWLAIIPMGAGFSGLLVLTLSAVLNSVEKHETATASGYVFVWRSLGQVFGVGVSGALMQITLYRELHERFDSEDIINKLRHASKAIEDLPEAWQQAQARKAYEISLRKTFVFSLISAVLVLVVSFIIPDDKLKAQREPVEQQMPDSSDPRAAGEGSA